MNLRFFVDNGFTKTKRENSHGDDLLSRGVAPQVPSALVGLTAGFGMEPGISPPLTTPENSLFCTLFHFN